VVYRSTTGSTNDDARALAAAGEPEGTVVVADEQTGGRGRAGKSRWLTPPNTCIAISALLRPILEPEALPALAAVCGVAAVEAVRSATGIKAVLKWPNDVMVGDRKLGGILVDSAIAGGRVDCAVAGLGLNVNLPASAFGDLPDAAVPPTTLLDELRHEVSRENLLIVLLRELDRWYGTIRSGHAFGVWRAYRERLATLGQRVRVSAGDEAVEGLAEDLASDGGLVVRLDDGTRRTFAYGEVTARGVQAA
jgi:BirA family biotin operon repressor/biotin-[acetyl-CoA-carboxylase] ligase